MCGIAGIVSRSRVGDRLPELLEQIAHRGPDGEGSLELSFGEWIATLGHRRLAIIDIKGGAQPMRMGERGAESAITYNGEIFNFQELMEDLRRKGASFQTRSDTEVLLQLLSRDSSARALRSLNGMYGFGFFSQKDGSLLLARDRLGIKPLYYASLSDGGIAFASELRALLPVIGDRSLDLQGVADFFFHDYVPAPRTVFRGIRKLSPSEYLIWRPDRPLEKGKYWSPDEIKPAPERPGRPESNEQELSRELLEILRRSVRRQLISDVPVGVFLSGGIDSSIVTALAAESVKDLKTFSIGFSEKSFDESSHARVIASRFGTQHTEEILSEAALLESIGAALGCLDEPLGDASILPTHAVSRLARKQVKVCLGGDGGDELWAGYAFYPAHRYAEAYARVPRLLRERFIMPLVHALPVSERYQSLEWKAKRFVDRFDEDRIHRHFRWLAGTDTRDLARFMPTLPQPEAIVSRADFEEGDYLNSLMKLDLTAYLPGSVLTKVDRATMGVGLESRPPLLDNELVEFSLAQPSALKLRNGTSKYLLKRVAGGLLPAEILSRPKQGFSVPIGKWLKGPLRERVVQALSSCELVSSGLLDRKALESAFEEHLSQKRDWSKTLWSLVVFDEWQRSIK